MSITPISINDSAKPPKRVSIETPAKLNLLLRVLGRRDDGYHELQSVFLSIGLYDTLSATARDDGELTLSIKDAAEDVSVEENLVLRAAGELRKRIAPASQQLGADFTLTKRIPSQAGLGGGSSDAAATLALLERLWRLQMTAADHHQIAATLGSDINFFVENTGLAIGLGRGEQIEALGEAGRFFVVVAKPPFGASTAEVFKELAACHVPEAHPEIDIDESIITVLMGEQCGENSLLEPLRAVCKDFDNWLESIEELAEGWSLTGSGTAVYRFMPNMTLARRLAHQITDRRDGTWAFAAENGRRAVAIS